MKCKGKHHSSICYKTTTTLLTTSSCSVTYPVVLIEIEGIKFRALIDNETLMSANTRKIKLYSVKIHDINCAFGFESELNI